MSDGMGNSPGGAEEAALKGPETQKINPEAVSAEAEDARAGVGNEVAGEVAGEVASDEVAADEVATEQAPVMTDANEAIVAENGGHNQMTKMVVDLGEKFPQFADSKAFTAILMLAAKYGALFSGLSTMAERTEEKDYIGQELDASELDALKLAEDIYTGIEMPVTNNNINLDSTNYAAKLLFGIETEIEDQTSLMAKIIHGGKNAEGVGVNVYKEVPKLPTAQMSAKSVITFSVKGENKATAGIINMNPELTGVIDINGNLHYYGPDIRKDIMGPEDQKVKVVIAQNKISDLFKSKLNFIGAYEKIVETPTEAVVASVEGKTPVTESKDSEDAKTDVAAGAKASADENTKTEKTGDEGTKTATSSSSSDKLAPVKESKGGDAVSANDEVAPAK